MADQRFRISGQVVDRRTGQGLRGLRVEAWDLDTRYHDMLGTDFTDRRGRFEIRFDASYFGDSRPDRLPDVYFRILQHDTLLRSTEKEVMRNLADTDAEVTLPIDLPGQPDAPVRVNRIGGQTARKGVAFARKSDFAGIRADLKGRASVARGLAGEMLKAKLAKLDVKPLRSSTVRTGAVFDQDVESVKHTLAAREVEVAEIKPYVAADSGKGLLSAALLPTRLKAGQKVDLFEEDGKVRYFAVVAEPGTGEQVKTLRADVETIREESAGKDRRIAELKDEVERVRVAAVSADDVKRLEARLVEREQQIAELKAEVKTVREAQAAVSADDVKRLEKELGERDRQITSLQAEVKTVREAQAAASTEDLKRLETELAERDRQITALQTDMKGVHEAQAGVSADDLKRVQAALAERERQVTALQAEVKTVREAQGAVSAEDLKRVQAGLAERDRQITSLQADLKSVREAQGAVSADDLKKVQAALTERDRQITALQADLKSVREAQVAVSAEDLKKVRTDLAELRQRLPSK